MKHACRITAIHSIGSLSRQTSVPSEKMAVVLVRFPVDVVFDVPFTGSPGQIGVLERSGFGATGAQCWTSPTTRPQLPGIGRNFGCSGIGRSERARWVGLLVVTTVSLRFPNA